MAANKQFGNHLRNIGGKIGAGMRSVWNHPLLLSLPLLVLAVFLGNLLLKEAFKPYTNCHYLIVNQLRMDAFFCEGYTAQAFGVTIFSLPGLKSVMDQPLEQLRAGIAWGVLLFFALISLPLTIFIENFQAVVRLLSFNQEEWQKFIASARIWLLLFVGFCVVFYFTVVK